MVVCKCRRATKLYCFVHKVPVCGDCIGQPEHTHCVVRTYSEWVIDGDYDWPPKCAKCEESLEDSSKPTTRLSCLHILHTTCLVDHIQSFPPYTAPAGFTCPGCPVQLWPPRNPKDANMVLYSNLKSVISKTTAANAVLGVEPASASASAHAPPAAFASSPIATISSAVNGATPETMTSSGDPHHLARGDGGVGTTGERSETSSGKGGTTSKLNGTGDGGPEIKVSPLHGPSSLPNAGTGVINQSSRKGFSPTAPGPMPPSFATSSRKASFRVDRGFADSTHGDEDDDDDDAHRKYARRGPFYRPWLQWLLPFWTPSSLPTLPISSVPRKDADGLAAEELIDGRGARDRRRARHQRALDPRKILLYFAILSCLATIILLYTRLAISGVGVAATKGDEHVVP